MSVCREENSSVSLGEYHRARLADVLEGYRKYDFEHDQRFQSGLSRIKATGDDLSVEQERMRVFYFSKYNGTKNIKSFFFLIIFVHAGLFSRSTGSNTTCTCSDQTKAPWTPTHCNL